MNFFEKILRFRLVDVDGVLITAGTSILVREPEDIGETQLTLKRDESTHGVYFEFTDAETPFIFDKVKASGETYSGYDLLKEIQYQKGVDGVCNFEIQENTGSWVTIYTGELDFGTYREIDYAIEILSRRQTLGDKFRTRKEIPIDFSASTSIDGTSITGLTPVSMHLHSKVIQQIQRATCSQLSSGSDLSTVEDYFLQWDYNTSSGVTEYRNTLEDEYGNENETVLYEALNNVPSSYVFERKQGELRIVVDANFDCIAENMDSETIILVGLYAEIDGTEEEVLAIGTNFPVTGALDSQTFTYSADKRINIPRGSTVKIYEKWTLPDTGAAHGVNFTVNSGHLATFTFNDVENNSDSDVYNTKEALNHVSEAITDSTNLVVSDFFDNNADQIYLTNGYLIRDFATASRPPKFSFDNLFTQFVSPSFGLGFSLLNDSGAYKCVIERYTYFYQDSEIIYIDDIVNDSYEKTTDKEIIFNRIKTGFSSYPSSTDENKSNNIDEFNTLNDHVTPIQRHRKTASYISSAIGSGYKIENQRRQQFQKTPKESASDDDKMFSIVGVNSNTYSIERITGDPVNVIFDSTANTISLYGAFFDIESESISISGSGMTNAGAYTVSSVARNGIYTVLTVASVSSDENFSDDYIITLSTTRLRAARNDEFETVVNVVDPNTIYNAGLNPKYTLFNNSTVFNSGFNPKSDASEVKTQEAKLNEDAQFKFASGEGGYVLDPDRTTVSMGGDLALSSINQNTKIFEGNEVTFKARLSYSEFTTIKDSLTDYNDANLHGYIRFKAPDGNDYKGYPISVSYELGSEMCTFVIKEQFTQRVNNFLLLETGDFLLLENGDKLILE